MAEFPTKYLVLASQRSGSTLLVESLRATGVAGEPEEYFQQLPETGRAPQPRDWFAGVSDPSLLELLPPSQPGAAEPESAVDRRDRILRAGCSPNGVWGGKLMWNQTALLQQWAAELPDRSGSDLRSAIRDVLGDDVLFVHVTRPDVVHQAVSFWRAVQTQTWRAPRERRADTKARYHAGGIAHLLQVLRNQERSWREWFTEAGITPMRVNYRDLAADTTAVVAAVLAALGQDPALAPPPALERQADVRSNSWVERYLVEAMAKGLPV
ncbi:trehalose 2-sulfotransferase [Skermania piniformis]|uniref:Trehalose 2-sulfotransferase n=1 Tax=Skermania pinensis TaxID=39122 RepID=A0ABX8SAP9_9ACTN|nr:Stf0 family sulfotransferase [Skermania piniformis]QXQ14943.1 Stf0 sulfotransferase family protein [Skermania piniformis]